VDHRNGDRAPLVFAQTGWERIGDAVRVVRPAR